MIDYVLKRVVAYAIDMFLVSVVVSSIATNSTINFQIDDYNKYYTEYLEMSSTYLEQQANKINSCDDLNSAVSNEKLTEKDYVKEVEELNKNKESLSSEEYDSKCMLIVNKYNDNKMTEEYVLEQIDYLYYMTEKNSVILYGVNIITCFLYFVLFQGFTYGQTLGKKIMRLKVVSNDGEKVSYKQLFFRTLFLYSIIYYLGLIIFSLVFKESLFIKVVHYLSIFNTALFLILGIMIIVNGRRGLHDVIGKTKVILMDRKGNEINIGKKLFITANDYKNNNTEEKVIEKEEILKDKTKKKTKHKSK